MIGEGGCLHILISNPVPELLQILVKEKNRNTEDEKQQQHEYLSINIHMEDADIVFICPLSFHGSIRSSPMRCKPS